MVTPFFGRPLCFTDVALAFAFAAASFACFFTKRSLGFSTSLYPMVSTMLAWSWSGSVSKALTSASAAFLFEDLLAVAFALAAFAAFALVLAFALAWDFPFGLIEGRFATLAVP